MPLAEESPLHADEPTSPFSCGKRHRTSLCSAQEKEQLQKTVSSAESEATQLRGSIAALADENAALKQQQSNLEAQIVALHELVASRFDLSISAAAGARSTENAERHHTPMVSTPTQTDVETDEASRLEIAKWQQQLSKMSEWLRTGAQLLEQPPSWIACQLPEPSDNKQSSLCAGHYSES